MTVTADDEAKVRQRDVQRLLGRCMLKLQLYERLIKAVVAHQELSGPVRDFEAIRAARVESVARKTLGTLVGEFLGSSLVSGEPKDVPDPKVDSSVDPPSVSMRIVLSLSEEDFFQAEEDLKDLVQLRNDLVHHFINQHDLWSVAGCRGAQEYLIAADERIDRSYARLREWAGDIDKGRQHMLEMIQSDAFREVMINGSAAGAVGE